LKDMIHGKLADDGKIDDMEYLVLRDTAKTSSISDERLFQLIEVEKNKLHIKDSVGTPDNKGDLFIEAKENKMNLSFNPWWLRYLMMVRKIDRRVIKEEKTKGEELKNRISVLKKDRIMYEKKYPDKVRVIDDKILAKTNELEEYLSTTQWGMHETLWEEISQYITSFLDNNFNFNTSSKGYEGDNDISSSEWTHSANRWEIGTLAYTYWTKIYKSNAPLNLSHHVGVVIAERFRWFPNAIDDSLAENLKKPATVVWQNEMPGNLSKVDIDRSLFKKKREFNRDLVLENKKELLELGANVLCNVKGDRLVQGGTGYYYENEVSMPLKLYLDCQDEYEVNTISSRIWNLDSFLNNGKLDIKSIDKYGNEVSIMMSILMNLVTMLNDYALEIGINQETYNKRINQYDRFREVMFEEYEKFYPKGTPFQPTNDEASRWRTYAREELGLESDYQYAMIFEDFRENSVTKIN